MDRENASDDFIIESLGMEEARTILDPVRLVAWEERQKLKEENVY